MFNEKKVATDVIKFIFAYLGAGFRFQIDLIPLHNAFYQIFQNPIYQNFFTENNIKFQNCGGLIFSNVITQALDRLQKSNLLLIIDLQQFEISQRLAESDPGFIFSKQEIFSLKQASNEFKRLIK